ncbi:hypothetical protein FBR43_04000 [Sphingomonas baiyangensis]|uniref:Cell wall polymerase n=2 Tax=Sphingomonas baiyangensis TaxID=2572576 RepID=A0A4U1L578_9SPHN|nr:hypothetical protein FBR43_04000 [Sphingomonas baiyangensis]
MRLLHLALERPRILGIACATGAVALGLFYLQLAGAPARYLLSNVAALGIGVLLLATLGRIAKDGERQGLAVTAMALALLATGLFGTAIEGATRWASLGGLSVQPSLLLLPLMVALFARRRDTLTTAALVIAGLGIAVQRDAAMAAALAASLAVLAALAPERRVLLALGTAIAGLVATLARADTVPAVPYVDGIIGSAFAVDAMSGVAVLGGLALLLVPGITGWRHPAERATHAVFGAMWVTIIAAAAIADYPTPVVGYGGSAIIGYLLALLALPSRMSVPADAGTRASDTADARGIEAPLLIGIA